MIRKCLCARCVDEIRYPLDNWLDHNLIQLAYNRLLQLRTRRAMISPTLLATTNDDLEQAALQENRLWCLSLMH